MGLARFKGSCALASCTWLGSMAASCAATPSEEPAPGATPDASPLVAVGDLPAREPDAGPSTGTEPNTTPPNTTQREDEPQEPTPTKDDVAYFARDVERVRAPYVRVEKANRLLLLYDGEELIARMRIGLGQSPVGDKTREGDSRTPEGMYSACSRNDKSRYYLSIGVSYPSIEDAQRGFDEERIDRDTYERIADAIDGGERPPWNTPLGGEIMIHGGGSSRDWTAGCIAVEDEDMDVLWKHVRTSTPIEIVP